MTTVKRGRGEESDGEVAYYFDESKNKLQRVDGDDDDDNDDDERWAPDEILVLNIFLSLFLYY